MTFFDVQSPWDKNPWDWHPDEIQDLRSRALGGDPEAVRELTLVLGYHQTASDIMRDLHGDQQRKLRDARSKAGKAKRLPTLDREQDVLDAYRAMRRHVSQRDDARRIASQLGMPFDTVRSILRRALKTRK